MHATASVETVVAVVGGLLAGVAVVPVPPDSGPVEREHVLRDSGATAWVGRRTRGGLPPVAARCPRTLAPATRGRDRAGPLHLRDDRAAQGRAWPTGRTLTACLDGLADAWAWTPDDTLVHGLPLFHVHGLVLGAARPAAGRLARWSTPAAHPRGVRRGAAAPSTSASRPCGRAWSAEPDLAPRARRGPPARLGQRPAAGPGVRRALRELTGQRPWSATG